MKEFSLVANDGNQFPELPAGLVLTFGNKRGALVYADYDGNADRPQPNDVRSDWFPLTRDFDTTMAWHGERKKQNGKECGRIIWRKQ